MAVGAVEGVYRGTIMNAQNAAQYTVQMAQTDASNLLAKDQADNTNALRAAGNDFAAAQAALSNTQRSIKNQQTSAAIGSQYNTHETNVIRMLDATVKGTVEQQIQSSAVLGALRADAAAKGVGGGSADIMRSTMRSTQARQANNAQEKVNTMSFDAMMASAGLRSNLIMSQDYGTTVANMNYQTAIPQTTIAPMKAPELTTAQMLLMGAAGGGGFQQFSQGNNRGTTLGGSGDDYNGSTGSTQGYSSQTILNGVESTNDSWSQTNAGGGNSYGFTLDNSSGSSGGGGGQNGSSSNFNFSLS
jgi:hypothetical protein